MNAIDTNIVVYLYDAAAPEKQARAQQLLDNLVLKSQETVWLWQVAVDFLACLRKAANQGAIAAENVPTEFRSILNLFYVKISTEQACL